MRKTLVVFFILFISRTVSACPFCDAGARDAASFIITIFGLLTLAGVFCFLVFVRRGGLKSKNTGIEMSVLDVEGIKNEQK